MKSSESTLRGKDIKQNQLVERGRGQERVLNQTNLQIILHWLHSIKGGEFAGANDLVPCLLKIKL